MRITNKIGFWRVEDPIIARNLEILPLRNGYTGGDGWMTLDKALEEGLAEVRDIGIVERVEIQTPPNPFVVIDGEEIKGARQDRMFVTSFFTRGQRVLEVPVACVEKGRWSDEESFESAKFVAPPSVRAVAQASIQLKGGTWRISPEMQERVWESVSQVLSWSDSVSAAPTMSMRAGQEFRENETSAYLVAPLLPRPRHSYTDVEKWLGDIPVFEDQVGVIFFAGGRFLGMDVTGSPALFACIYQRLLESAALEAYILRTEGQEDLPTEAETESQLEGVLRFARSFEKWSESPGVGDGIERRKRGRKYIGKVLMDGTDIVHLSVHPMPAST